jgi:uncharacterized protein
MLAALRHPIRALLELHEASIERGRAGLDLRPIIAFLVVAVSLTLQEFFGDRITFRDLEVLHDSDAWELWSWTWWAGWRVLGFLVLPALVVALLPGERLADYGWSLAGLRGHWKVYLLLYLLVLPAVVYVSTTPDFQRIYPFYRAARRSPFDFWAWEALYAAQFVSLEFFFRGFMLFACRGALGVYSVFAMVIPYCMIHYGKTFSETMGAIVAGSVLGLLALKTRSIWGGIFVHVAVALTMDLLAVRYIGVP